MPTDTNCGQNDHSLSKFTVKIQDREQWKVDLSVTAQDIVCFTDEYRAKQLSGYSALIEVRQGGHTSLTNIFALLGKF